MTPFFLFCLSSIPFKLWQSKNNGPVEDKFDSKSPPAYDNFQNCLIVRFNEGDRKHTRSRLGENRAFLIEKLTFNNSVAAKKDEYSSLPKPLGRGNPRNNNISGLFPSLPLKQRFQCTKTTLHPAFLILTNC